MLDDALLHLFVGHLKFISPVGESDSKENSCAEARAFDRPVEGCFHDHVKAAIACGERLGICEVLIANF